MPVKAMKVCKPVEFQHHTSLTLALDRHDWSASCPGPGRFITGTHEKLRWPAVPVLPQPLIEAHVSTAVHVVVWVLYRLLSRLLVHT